jgi:hypothetical protein
MGWNEVILWGRGLVLEIASIGKFSLTQLLLFVSFVGPQCLFHFRVGILFYA